MKRSAPSCLKCNVNSANPGKKYCQRCYEGSKPGKTYLCSKCNQCPPNTGHTLCQLCYEKSIVKCSKCHTNKANPGKTMCSSCYQSQKTNWSLCIKCYVNLPNPGYPTCEQCYLNSRSTKSKSKSITNSKSNESNANICKSCNIANANPGKTMCQICYINSKSKCKKCKQQQRNQGYVLCQTCYLKTKSQSQSQSSNPIFCQQCFINIANSGHTLCQTCYLAKKSAKSTKPKNKKAKFSNLNSNKFIGDSNGIDTSNMDQRTSRFISDKNSVDFPDSIRTLPAFMEPFYYPKNSLKDEFEKNGFGDSYEAVRKDIESNQMILTEMKSRGLNIDHAIALRSYSGSMYFELNTGLIQLIGWEKWETLHYNLYDALQKCTYTNIDGPTLYRGFSSKIGHKVGDIIVFRNWTSTSTEEGVANAFAWGGCTMHIKNWKLGLDMGWISYYPSEAEVLLEAFQQYKITSITKDGTIIEIEQLKKF